MKHGGKLFALSTAAVALAVALTAAIVGWPWLVEEYHLNRLSSSQEATRLAAAEALSEMKSLRAVPHLIVLLAGERREIAQRWTATTNDSVREGMSLTPVAYGLYRIGSGALPWLSGAELKRMFESCEQLRKSDKYTQDLLAEIARAISAPGLIVVNRQDYAEDAFFGTRLR